MKSLNSILILIALLAGGLTARASVDVSVNGTEYAITTVTGGFQSLVSQLQANPFYTGVFLDTPAYSTNANVGLPPTGGASQTTWEGQPLSFENNPATTFQAAYQAAGGDANAVFAFWLDGYNNPPLEAQFQTSTGYESQSTSDTGYATTEYAFATVVVPESSTMGLAAGALLFMWVLVDRRNSRRRTT